ncbi:unnamed protein product [Ilex paraguariensis]|uniref:Uncharacterized protein n=1 Tax=Ilex paraguariensis TaxID=185542 RepID=A0ABC8R018_9AQUA
MVIDVAEVTMSDSLSKVMIDITVNRPDGSGKLVLDGDEQLQEMFFLYRNCKEILVFVNVEVGSQVRLSPPPDVGIGEEPNVDDNEPNVQNDDTDANRHEVKHDIVDEHTGGSGENDDRGANRHEVDDANDDNVYVDGDDAPNVSYEYNDDTINTQLDENCDDEFSDYQSGDEGYVSNTNSEELEVDVDETHTRGRKRKCNVSDTSRFGVEFSVPEDGNTD